MSRQPLTGARRVVAVASSFPVDGAPTASIFLADWADELARLGHDVHVLAPAVAAHRGSASMRGDLQVETLGYAWPPSWQTLAYGSGMFDNLRENPARLLQSAPLVMRLAQRVRAHAARADVIHAHWLVPGGLAAVLARPERDVPLVVTVHSTDLHLLRTVPGGRMLARFIAARASCIHFVAQYLQRQFVELIGDATAIPDMYVTPMGYGRGFAPTPLSGTPRVGFIGRLIPLKGTATLLHACARAGVERVVIAGGGPELPRLRALAAQLSVDAEFLGPVAPEARASFFARCDVVVFPSLRYASGRTEGTPVALLEALRCGRVVIASDAGGIGEVVTHGANGHLVPPGDPDALASALDAVIAGWPDARRMGEACPGSVAHLSAAHAARAHQRAYEALVRGHRLTHASPLPADGWV